MSFVKASSYFWSWQSSVEYKDEEQGMSPFHTSIHFYLEQKNYCKLL